MKNQKIAKLLAKNDRHGENAIALFQALIAIVVMSFHIISAAKNNWSTFNSTIILIICCILAASVIRVRIAAKEKLYNLRLHGLSVLDGMLIFVLILSYSHAYNLPLETSFKAPSTIFLVLYTVVRVMRFDPVPVLVAGTTVLVGWFSMLGIVLINGAQITQSYSEYITTEKLLIGATIEMALGYFGLVIVLVIAMVYARRFVTSTAHVEDLAIANLRAEDNLAIYDELLNSSIDGIVIVDGKGVIERVNPALGNLFGYSQGEMVGQNVSMLMSNDNAALLRGAIDTFVRTNESHLVGQSYETFGKHRNGEVLEIELSISEFVASGKQCFAGFMRDISDRKKAHKREQRALARFEQAVNAAMDAIIVINETGKIVSFNPAAEEIFGFCRSDAVGQQLSELIIPEKHRSAHEEGLQHYLKTGEGPVLASRFEIKGLHAEGRELQIELAIKDIDGPNGKLFIGYARDISERKVAEAELLAAKNTAEVTNRAKASFLAMMSHEIRTPLNGVLGIMSLLNDTSLDGNQKLLLQTAKDSGQSLLTIINDILDFSKLEAGKFEIQEHSFNTGKLMDSVINLIMPQAEDKKLQIILDINKAVPEYILGDADRIRQILLNLVWNAIKFTEIGRIDVTCNVVRDNETQHIRFSVKDTGIGIPAENLDELFAEFKTLDSGYVSKFGGTGLGLAICKALVVAMNGKIGVESKLGMGSDFWFALPLIEGEKILSADKVEDAEFDVLNNLDGKWILIAEDNATNQLVISRFLTQLNCRFDLVGNGKEALDAMQKRDYDLALMDISMPVMDGYEAIRQIRALENKHSLIPVIALTAYASSDDRKMLLSAGMNDVLSKPVFKNDLAKCIQKNLKDANDLLTSSKDNDIVDSQQYFDLEILEQILEDMNISELDTMFQKFHEDMQRYSVNAQEAVDGDDIAALEKASHGLAGMSGIFGALKLSEKASEINDYCRDTILQINDHQLLLKTTLEMLKLTKNTIKEADHLKTRYRKQLQKDAS